MNRILKIGDRVRNVRVDVYKDEPIVIVGESDNNNSLKIKFNRYQIKYLNVFTVSGDNNMMSWVDESDIVLDIEYYRNEKLNKILE